MKQLLTTILLLGIFFYASAQTYSGSTIEARTKLIINLKKVLGIRDDSTTTNGSGDYLITERAAKAYARLAAVLYGGGGGLSDGDKGDITVTGGVWSIDNNTITTSKINDAAVTLAKLAGLIDSTKVPTLHSQAYYDSRYKAIGYNPGLETILSNSSILSGAHTINAGTNNLFFNWDNPYSGNQHLYINHGHFSEYTLGNGDPYSRINMGSYEIGGGGNSNEISVGNHELYGIRLNSGNGFGEHKWIQVRTDSIIIGAFNGVQNHAITVTGTGAGPQTVTFPSTQVASDTLGRYIALLNNNKIEKVRIGSINGGLNTPKISSLSSATGSNTLEVGDYTQVWNFTGLTPAGGLRLTASGTSGSTTGTNLLSLSVTGAAPSSNHQALGLFVSNDRTGSGKNIAAQFQSSGGTSNAAIYVPSGGVVIGSYNPGNSLSVSGTSSLATANITTLTAGTGSVTSTFTVPTVSLSDSSDNAATTKFVKQAISSAVSGGTAGVTSFNGRTGTVTPTSGDYTVAQVIGAAPLASPALTGAPTAPTPAYTDNSTKIATTEFAYHMARDSGFFSGYHIIGDGTSANPFKIDSTHTKVQPSNIQATGFAGGGTKFLADDNTWKTVSGSMSIGGSVTSGTANNILYVGTGPVLAQDNNFNYSSGKLSVGSTGGTGVLNLKASSAVNTDLKLTDGSNTETWGAAARTDGGFSFFHSSATPFKINQFSPDNSIVITTGGVTVKEPTVSVGAIPSAPSSGNVKMYGTAETGYSGIGIINSDGQGYTMQRSFAEGKKRIWIGNTTTTPTAIGTAALTATGTATAAAIALTNMHTKLQGTEYLVTTAATTAVAGWREAANGFWMGNTANDGGFEFICTFGPATGVSTTTDRLFVGMSTSTSAPTDVEPSSLTNMFGVGYDAADANLQFMRNDGTGTATKTDLGSNFVVPTADRTDVYKLVMSCPPNSTTITYKITNLTSGNTATGSVNSDIPAVNTLMSGRGYISVGGTSSVIGIALKYLEISSFR